MCCVCVCVCVCSCVFVCRYTYIYMYRMICLSSVCCRCGVIQEGDRILAINDVTLENKTLEEANRMLKEAGVKVLLQVEFDVAGWCHCNTCRW